MVEKVLKMDYSMIVLGLGSGIIFVGIVTLLFKILDFIAEEPEASMKKLFLKKEALNGFKVLAASNAILAVPLALESIALLSNNPARAAMARYTMPIPMIGYLYFYIQLYRTMKPYEKEN